MKEMTVKSFGLGLHLCSYIHMNVPFIIRNNHYNSLTSAGLPSKPKQR